MSALKTVDAAKASTGHSWLRPLENFINTVIAFLNAFRGVAFAPVRVATAGALPANTYSSTALTKTASSNGALGAIDGVTVAVGDRILVKDEVTGSENGIYVVTALGGASAKWVLTRASDANASADFANGKTVVAGSEGSANANKLFRVSNATFTLDTDALTLASVVTGATTPTAAFVAGLGSALLSGITVGWTGNVATVSAGGGTYAQDALVGCYLDDGSHPRALIVANSALTASSGTITVASIAPTGTTVSIVPPANPTVASHTHAEN